MAYFLFIDESGIDRQESPYEVLAGISVHESRVWSFISAIQQAEIGHFGTRLTDGNLELKAKKLLKKKTFKFAQVDSEIPRDERNDLVREFLRETELAKNESRSPDISNRHFAAFGQAKIAFCGAVFEIAGHHQVKTFASIVPRNAPRPQRDYLRKDYAYLFERFFHYLESVNQVDHGIVVFDELERSKCTILIDQMTRYFRETATGKARASRVIPEPFFVHSELTSLVQVADLLAYIINWGVRIKGMDEPAREELCDLAEQVKQLRSHTIIADAEEATTFQQWGFKVIDDLRSRDEKACS